jgi:hypothetical protein
MAMNALKCPEVPRETDPVREPRGAPRVDNMPQEFVSGEQTPSLTPARPYVPDEGGFKTFVGGAGI